MERDLTYEKQHRQRKHIHKYVRRIRAGILYWCCADPVCNHFMPKHQEFMMEGRASLCNDCEEPFVLDEEMLAKNEAFKPVCDKCASKELTNAFDRYLTERGDIIDRTTK